MKTRINALSGILRPALALAMVPAMLGVVGAAASNADGIVIVALRTPRNMERPWDAAAYTFPVTLTFRINAAEAAAGTNFDVIYKDWFGGFGIAAVSEVDGIHITIPAGVFPAGAVLVARFDLACGCDPAPVGSLPGVFGPMSGGGATGSDPMIGEFLFPGLGAVVGGVAGNLWWGTNRVECITGNGGGPAHASNGPVEEMYPQNPPSQDPQHLPRPPRDIMAVAYCPADVDDGSGMGHPDGGITIDDLLYYLGSFASGSIEADLDDGSSEGQPDGGVTIDDLLYFLARFTAGC